MSNTPGLQQAIEHGDQPELRARRLIDSYTAGNATASALAQMFPQATMIVAIRAGQPPVTLAFVDSQAAHHFLPDAMAASKGLATILADVLPDEPLAAIAVIVNAALETRRLRAEREAARAAAKQSEI